MKSFIFSKTFWFNVLTTLAVFLPELLDKGLSRGWMGAVLVLSTLVNVILRVYFTKTELIW